MVISDKHKYLFIELFFTGSTAISYELCHLYDGKKIINKHSRYHEFLEIATEEQKKYFVFSGIRNPMDTIVSFYMKFVTNHQGQYTDPKYYRENGGPITKKNLRLYHKIKDLSFEEYFMRFHKLPYDNWTNTAHKKFDYLIRFEDMQNGFDEVLEKLHIQKVRDIPQKNKTADKKSFLDYYTPAIRKRAIFVFGPYMKKWGYTFPPEWNAKEPSLWSRFLFFSVGILKKYYWGHTKSKSIND